MFSNGSHGVWRLIYYPIIFVDAIHVKVHRKRSVENEAFYVVLGVKEDKSREVPGIFNRPIQKDFMRVLRIRGAMPTEESVIVFMAKTAIGKKVYFRALPGIERDKVLFPDDSGNFLDLLNNS